MKRNRRFRGVSLGTVLALVLTVVVLVGMVRVLTPLMGDTAHISMNVENVFSVLDMAGEYLPQLTLSDIPIYQGQTAQPQPVEATVVPQQPQVTPMMTVPPTQAPTQAPTATPIPSGTFTLTIGGSVNMDEAVRQSGYYSDSKKYDFSEMLSLIKDEFTGDLTMVTLENLTLADVKVSNLNAPRDVMEALSQANIDVVGLGFDQIYDKGQEGLTETVHAARQAGLTTVGAYVDEQDAANIRMFDLDGIKVALMHYTEDLSKTSNSELKKSGATYAVPMAEEDRIRSDIEFARQQGARFIIASMHWGKEGTTAVTKAQQQLAQKMADMGVHLIVGTGTLVTQEAVWLNGTTPDGKLQQTLCAYSLGSLMNESRKDGNVASMLLQVTVTCDSTGGVNFNKVAYTPTYIWRYKADGKYYYRAVASDQEPPFGMDDDQIGYMEKAYGNIKKRLEGSPLQVR
ncbi:MAG: CapA family protein [Clostridiales bacterium]|nr:CapA family protein [Clostridiales bacterium]